MFGLFRKLIRCGRAYLAFAIDQAWAKSDHWQDGQYEINKKRVIGLATWSMLCANILTSKLPDSPYEQSADYNCITNYRDLMTLEVQKVIYTVKGLKVVWVMLHYFRKQTFPSTR